MLHKNAVFVVSVALLVQSCSSSSPRKVEEPQAKKAVEPISGRKAFHQAYITARTWAQDLQVLRVRDIPVDGVPKEPGKAGAWEITFISPGKSAAKAYTYSVVESGNIHEGVFGGLEERYSGPRGQASPFLIAAFKTDSVEAWETAAGKSKEYMEKNPDVPITFLLEKTPRHPNPAWRVIWGTSAATSGYSIYVDASTGEYLERMR